MGEGGGREKGGWGGEGGMGEGRDGKGGKSESPHLIVRYIRPSIKHKIIDTPYIAILYNCFIS